MTTPFYNAEAPAGHANTLTVLYGAGGYASTLTILYGTAVHANI